MTRSPIAWADISPRLDELLLLSRDEQSHRLDEIAASDPALGERLRELLATSDELSRAGFLSDPVVDALLLPAFQPGASVGAWTLVEPIGEGGMGSVWRARRNDGRFEGEAAIKLLRLGLTGSSAQQRFRREGAILASLRHPGIAQLLDAGITPQDVPYLVLELVRGERIDRWCDERHLPARARIALALQVLDAVSAAHGQLVIHRDLKPSNILVDATGRVRLLDFGIARLLPGAGAGETMLTREGMPALTPAYAPPEQFESIGTDSTPSTAIDVYALGVLLHELLVGVHPSGLHNAGLVQYLQAAQRGPDRRASDWARQPIDDAGSPDERAARRATTVRGLAAALRGDLDAILVKALAPKAAGRYGSVEAFAEDLRRHLESRPIRARKAAVWYVVGKQLRRHAWTYAALSALVVVLGAGVATTLWQARLARAEAARANAVQRFVLDMFRRNSSRQADPQRARDTKARELLDIGSAQLAQSLADDPAGRMDISATLAQMYSDMGLIERAAELRREAVHLAEAVYGPRSLELVEALANLAGELNHVAPLEERRELLERGLAIVQARPDRPSRERADLYRRLSEFERSRDPRASIRYADLAVADAERLDDDAVRFRALQDAGIGRLGMNDLEDAVASLQRAVAAGDRCQCVFPSDLIGLRAHLAEAQGQLLDLAGAERTLRAALADSQRLNGEHHLDTIQTSLRLANILNNNGRPRETVALLEPLRPAIDGPSGADEFSGPHLLYVLGNALSELGRNDDAIRTLERAIELRERARANTVFTGVLRRALAREFVRAGRFAEAEALLQASERNLRAAGAKPGEERWSVLAEVYTRLHLARGDIEGARRRVEELPDGIESGARPSLAAIRSSLMRAQVDLESGRDDEAVRRLVAVRDLIAARHLAEQLPIFEARRHLLCGRWSIAHAPKQARSHIEQSLVLLREHLGPDGEAQSEAESLLARAIARKEAPGPAGAC